MFPQTDFGEPLSSARNWQPTRRHSWYHRWNIRHSSK